MPWQSEDEFIKSWTKLINGATFWETLFKHLAITEEEGWWEEKNLSLTIENFEIFGDRDEAETSFCRPTDWWVYTFPEKMITLVAEGRGWGGAELMPLSNL